MTKWLRRLSLLISMLFLVPALAVAQLQTGDGVPADLSKHLSELMQKGTYRYAITACNGIDNALLLVRLQSYTVLQFYQKENGRWAITNIASDFCLPLTPDATISGDDQHLTVTVPAIAPTDAQEQFLFVWEQVDYVLRSYTLSNADGTGMALLMDANSVTLTITASPGATPAPPITVKNTPQTAFLFAPIYTGHDAENRGGRNADSDRFYAALYAVQQAAGWASNSQTATIAMAPVVTAGLNLRAAADAGAATRGTFFGGVTVQILQDQVSDRRGGLWCEVQIGALTGYMKRSYLSFTPGDHSWNTATTAPQGQTNAEATVYSAVNGGEKVTGLAAKTPVSILGMSGDQFYIAFDGGYGFIPKSQIQVTRTDPATP